MSISPCLTSVECKTCHINQLPTESLLQIFCYLPVKELVSCSCTCKRWWEIVSDCETIWKRQCRTLKNCHEHIAADRQSGKSWKETFCSNYGYSGIKRLWQEGAFSNPSSYLDLPDKPFCNLDTAAWAQILDWELERC